MDRESLYQGKAPESEDLLMKTTVGLESLVDFLQEKYLTNYIPAGGSKIKFITGRPGSGKSQLAGLMRARAKANGYQVVSFSAKTIWLHDFKEIYLEILRQCQIENILKGCAEQIILTLGYDPSAVAEGKSLIDYLSEQGELDPIVRGEIRAELRTRFTRNPRLDNGFAYACSLITGGILGHPVLETANHDILLRYLSGDKTVKLAGLRALGLPPSRVTKYNARNLLRSLAEIIHLSGKKGLLVVIDDMEVLLSKKGNESIHYTKGRRDDTYESIRQLIDDIDNMHYIMFLMCFDRELMDNDSYGMKSYQALWMRIQNEVVSARFNRFGDIIDMDRYGDEFYTTDLLLEMAERLLHILAEDGITGYSISEEEAGNLRERALFGGLGLPYMVNRKVLEGERDGL